MKYPIVAMIWSVFLTFATTRPGLAYLSLASILGFAIWTIWALIIIFRKPERRHRIYMHMVIYLIPLAFVNFINWRYFQAVREKADNISAHVKSYYAAHGSYPTSLKAAGMGTIADQNDIYSVDSNGSPNLTYISPWAIFESYYYDFKNQSWKLKRY